MTVDDSSLIVAPHPETDFKSRHRRPVKIAVVIPRYGLVGGGEMFALELTERIAEMSSSYEIHVFANQWRQRSGRIHFHKVPIVSFPKYLSTASFAWFVQRRINEIGFDIIHSHERIFNADIVSLHSTPHRLWIRAVRKKRFPSLFDRVTIRVEECMVHNNDKTLFLPVSSITRDWFIEEYPFAAERTRVMHPGVEMAKFERLDRHECRKDIRARFGFLNADTVLLFVGMNFELKGLEPLILAMGRSKSLAPEKPLKLLVVGKGNRDKYRKLAQDNGVGDDIRFAGVIQEKIEEIYLAADFYAMLSAFDTFGMTVLEAMAASLPVIVSPHVGAKDLVQEGVNGFIVEREEIDAVSRKILLLLDHEKRTMMGDNAHRIAKGHTWDVMADQIRGLYEEILSRKYG
jgi:UDP-glucose:(heptosyl)LPS alpha-1,3-glucosyltransferase